MSLVTLDVVRLELAALCVDSFGDTSIHGRFGGVDEHHLSVDEQCLQLFYSLCCVTSCSLKDRMSEEEERTRLSYAISEKNECNFRHC